MAKAPKFNLVIIDRTVELENFKYRGLSVGDKQNVISAFTQCMPSITFTHDEGEVYIATSTIHSLCFSAYISEEDEIDQLREED